MSDYRDTLKNAIENGIILDSCNYDERQKVWGRYIDLCGMTVKDAIPLGPEDCGGGGGGDKSGKTKNTVTFLMVENGQGNYTLNLSVEHASTNEYKASFVMDGATKLVTVPAGVSLFDTELTGYDVQKPYSIISDITILSESTTYNYVAKNTVKTGIFVLTINDNGTQTKENVKYNTVYELPVVVERPGYDYIWKDENGAVITGNTITMPEKDTTVNGTYVIQNYTLTYNIIEYNYENNNITSSITSDELTLPYGTNILNAVSGLTPEKEGHTKEGWKYEDNTLVLSGDTLLGNTTTIFIYSLNQYSLTYLSEGETFAEETYYFGQNIEPLGTVPEKVGYTFNEWDNEIPQTMPSQNIVLNAIFNINSYNLTYFVDGVEKYVDTYEYGAAITARPNETKEGYTFSGWDYVPVTMPAHDEDVLGTFTINSHLVTFNVDGELYYSAITEYGEEIAIPTEPTRSGYTFSGWGEIPETMPDEDVVINGTFTVNIHKLTYLVDGNIYYSANTEYGTVITPLPEPTRTGYTFSGWDNVPATMPDNDVTVNGTFTINQYTLTYLVDEEPWSAQTYEYGEAIEPLPTPEEREGYTFSGWSGIPATMPAHDVTVRGTFNANQYQLKYYVDGTFYTGTTYRYGAAIIPQPSPIKNGYTFSGWDYIPTTMPAHDVDVNGTFTINQYTLTFTIDSEPYTSITADYMSQITVPTPSKSGYTFSGWNKPVPSTMPAYNDSFSGSYVTNSYTANYVIDGQQYSSVTYQYGATIIYPSVPSRSGYTFAWAEEYITMPANDIVINGTYTPVSSSEEIYYNAIYTSGDTNVSSITGFNHYEYDNGIETSIVFTIPANPDYATAEEELEEEEFEQWCEDHSYSIYFASPTGTTFTFTDVLGNNLTGLVADVGAPFSVNGKLYRGHAYRTGICCISTDKNLTYKLTFVKN